MSNFLFFCGVGGIRSCSHIWKSGRRKHPPGEYSTWNETHPYRLYIRDPSRGDVGQESGALSRLNPKQGIDVEVHLEWASASFFHSAKSPLERFNIQLRLLVLRSGGCPIFNDDNSVHTSYIFSCGAGVLSPRAGTPCRHPTLCDARCCSMQSGQ